VCVCVCVGGEGGHVQRCALMMCRFGDCRCRTGPVLLAHGLLWQHLHHTVAVSQPAGVVPSEPMLIHGLVHDLSFLCSILHISVPKAASAVCDHYQQALT
jgi:hypothetical protein